MGAYRVSQYGYRESRSRPAGMDHVRLLSDGRILVGSGSHSLREFVVETLNHEGLGDKGLYSHFAPFTLDGLRQFVGGLPRLASG